MPDESGRFTAEHTVMDKDLEIRELKHLLEVKDEKIKDDKPVVLDLEIVKVLKPGKFEVDVVNLMKGKPIIFRTEKGKYVIDLASTFQQIRKK